jgi:hypothetical protein
MIPHKLIVVRSDGLVTETTFSGWNSEGISDRLFNEAKEHPLTIFACTQYTEVENASRQPVVYGRQWYANEERVK